MLYDSKITYLNSYTDNDKKFDRSVQRTALDQYVYEDICKESYDDVFLNFHNGHIGKRAFIEGISEDVFNCLYKIDPRVNHEDNLTTEAKVRNKVFRKLIETPNFQALRNKTISNLFESALASKYLYPTIERMTEDLFLNSSSFRDVMNDLQEVSELEEELKDDNVSDKDSILKQISDLNDNIESALNEGDNFLNSFGASIDRGIEFFESNMKESMSNFSSILSFIDGFGKGNSKAEKLPIKDKMEIANSLVECPKFKQVCEALGRMQEMINKLPKIPTDKGYEYADISLGHSVPRVLSSEKVLLTDNKIEDFFFKKFSSKSLLEFKTKGYEEGKGPIIICLDESGSMKGEQDIWAKSFTMACLQLAYRQKRNCCVIPFSSYVSNSFEFYYKDFDYKSMVKCCSLFLGGGTNYEQPLCKAVKYIKKSKSFKKADILFITDGDADSISSRTLNDLGELKSNETKIQAVLIGNDVEEDTIKTFADSIVRVENLDKDNVIIDVFDNIIK